MFFRRRKVHITFNESKWIFNICFSETVEVNKKPHHIFYIAPTSLTSVHVRPQIALHKNLPNKRLGLAHLLGSRNMSLKSSQAGQLDKKKLAKDFLVTQPRAFSPIFQGTLTINRSGFISLACDPTSSVMIFPIFLGNVTKHGHAS